MSCVFLCVFLCGVVFQAVVPLVLVSLFLAPGSAHVLAWTSYLSSPFLYMVHVWRNTC